MFYVYPSKVHKTYCFNFTCVFIFSANNVQHIFLVYLLLTLKNLEVGGGIKRTKEYEFEGLMNHKCYFFRRKTTFCKMVTIQQLLDLICAAVVGWDTPNAKFRKKIPIIFIPHTKFCLKF